MIQQILLRFTAFIYFFYDMVIEGSIISKCLDQIARTGKLFASAKIAVGHVFSPPQFKGAQL